MLRVCSEEHTHTYCHQDPARHASGIRLSLGATGCVCLWSECPHKEGKVMAYLGYLESGFGFRVKAGNKMQLKKIEGQFEPCLSSLFSLTSHLGELYH